MNCPHCGNPLRPGARFCATCGQLVDLSAGSLPASSASPGTGAAPAAPVAPPSGSAAPAPVPPPSFAPAPQPFAASVPQLGATGQGSSLWGPFAGYGTRREHTAWLLQGLGSRAEQLRDTITQQFQQRQIPQAQVTQLKLTGRGVAVEQRPFYRVQRGLATVWLYVARFGQDLYISQVSYIKGQISLGRVLIVAALGGLSLLGWLNLLGVGINLMEVVQSIGSSLLGGKSTEPNGFLMSMLCCTGPLGLLAQVILLLGLVFSIYKFLTEKDFLVLLRSAPTEFQEDDIVSLEKAVNETVRQAADIVGIDLKLLAPGQAYQRGRRLI